MVQLLLHEKPLAGNNRDPTSRRLIVRLADERFSFWLATHCRCSFKLANDVIPLDFKDNAFSEAPGGRESTMTFFCG